MGSIAPLKGKEAKAPQLDTIRSVESVFTVGPSEWWRCNPDDLVRQKGIAVYRKMRLDDQVKSASVFKRDAIVSRGWTFTYEDSSKLSPEEQQRRIKIFEGIVEAYPGSFVDAINGVATGKDYGFSLTEKVFSAVDLDTGPAIGISALRYRDPSLFEFVTDPFGSLVEFRQRAGGQVIVLDIADFIHYVHSPEADPYFGQSDLRAAYKYWYIKSQVQNFWASWLERMAGGFGVFTAKDGTAPKPTTPDYAAMQQTLATLRGSSGLIVPAGVEFKLEQQTDTKAFQDFVEFADLGIARSMLVPNLLGASHTGQTGAYSQSQTQLEAFYWTLQQDQARLEACLNEQLFKPLAAMNFTDEDGPCFEFKPLSEERLRWLVTTWSSLITGGAVVATEEDEAYLRKLLSMPERDEGATVLVTPTEQLQRDQMQQDQKNNQANRDAKQQQTQDAQDAQAQKYRALEEKVESLTLAIAKLSTNPITVNLPPHAATSSTATDANDGGSAGAAGNLNIHVHGVPQHISLAVAKAAAARVAFAVIEQRQTDATARVVADLASVVAKAVSRVLSNDRIDKALAAPDKISTVKLSSDEVGQIKQVLKGGFVNSYIDGVTTARGELDRAGLHESQRMARQTFATLKNVAADYLEANAFRYAGNVSDGVRSIIQQELLNGVKAGSTVKDIRVAVWDRLVAKGMTSREAANGEVSDEAESNALDDLWVDTEAQAAAYLTTVVRTNLFDSFNEGRWTEFHDPVLGDFVAAFEYSAVLDDRTTEICQDLDGSTWDTDNELWEKYRPPNHYNCRSVLVPITQLDIERGEWDEEESPPPRVEPQDGFGQGQKG